MFYRIYVLIFSHLNVNVLIRPFCSDRRLHGYTVRRLRDEEMRRAAPIPLLLEGVAAGQGSDAKNWPKAIIIIKQGWLAPICLYYYPAIRAPVAGKPAFPLRSA